ncbi:MAG: hypothetical protein OEY59_04940 [Deltaproteobacteria bacterium]|nr:hypothetical protein [Deltaproteobacteria bacterium]
MALDEPQEDDIQVIANEIRVIYDPEDEQYVRNSVIDFEESYFGKSFMIRSANSSRC